MLSSGIAGQKLNSRSSVVVYNHQGQVLQTNKATRHLFGIPSLPVQDQVQREQELLLQTVHRDEQGQLLPEKRQPLSRLLKGEVFTGTKAADVLVSTPGGHKVMLNMSGAPIRSETGGIKGAVLILRQCQLGHQLRVRIGGDGASFAFDRVNRPIVV